MPTSNVNETIAAMENVDVKPINEQQTGAAEEAKTATEAAAEKAAANDAADVAAEADDNAGKESPKRPPITGKRAFKCIFAVVATLAFVALLNAAVTFVLDPFGSKSQVIWHEYFQEEEIDTVFFGTSLSARSFDTEVVNEELDMHAYNMSTPGQWIEESYLGLQAVLEERDIDTVVLGFEFSEVQGTKAPDPGRPFVRYMNQNDFGRGVRDTLWLLSNPRCYEETSSINWMFPWITNHVKMTPSKIVGNVRMKLDGTDMLEAAIANEKGWTYYGHGYGNYEEQVYNYDKDTTTTLPSKYGRKTFDEEKLQTLGDFCDYCAERGITVYVVASPTPKFNVLDYGDKYFKQTQQLVEFVEAHGGEYYDLNLAKPELLELGEGDFADFQHLNTLGGQKTTHAFVELMKLRRAGESVDDLFYGQDDFYANAHNIEMVKVEKEGSLDEGITVNARAITGPNEEIEFCLMMNDGPESWTMVHDWTTDTTLTYQPEESGTYKMCVYARHVGSDAEFERYRTFTIAV